MKGFRISTLDEREEFYSRGFDIGKLKQWLRNLPQFFCIDVGSETKIYKKEHEKRMDKITILGPDLTLEQLRQKLINYLPEDVYYDRNIYKDVKKCTSCWKFDQCFECDNLLGQQLVFDIDAENIECSCDKEKLPKMCEKCLLQALKNGLEMKKQLSEQFKDIEIVYSGRGWHVYVHDDAAYKLTREQRIELSKQFKDYAIDSWVSSGKKRLVRLPFSLNSLVSRIVTPVKDEEINRILSSKKIIPRFI